MKKIILPKQKKRVIRGFRGKNFKESSLTQDGLGRIVHENENFLSYEANEIDEVFSTMLFITVNSFYVNFTANFHAFTRNLKVLKIPSHNV